MSKDYYKILGIEKKATPEQVKAAFRRLALQHHPDKGGDPEKFKEANEAYQVLGDESKRSQYDRFGSVPEGAGFNGGGNPFGGFGGMNMEDLGDIFGGFGFGDIFGGGRGGAKARTQGRDIEVEAKIEFREAAFGVTKRVELYAPVVCATCGGNGGEPGSKADTCGTCHGTGKITRSQRTPFGVFETASACTACQGEGKTFEKKCHRCHGGGAVKESRHLDVSIPAGIHDGARIRVTGEGEAGAKGAPAGDLYLHIRIKHDTRLTREGDDVHTAEMVSVSDALLGATAKTETIDGEVEVKIPAGVEHGTVLRLKGKGIPHLRGGGRGDHFVAIKIEIPKKLNKKQKQLIEELKKEGM